MNWAARDLQSSTESSSPSGLKLTTGDLSSGSSSELERKVKDKSDMANPTRDEIDAKLNATEARIETAMARMDSRIDKLGDKLDSAMAVMNTRLDHLPSTWVLVTTVFGAFVATMAAVAGLLSYGGDRFDSGALIATQITETRLLSDENARQIKTVAERLDALPGKILDAIEKKDKAPGDKARSGTP